MVDHRKFVVAASPGSPYGVRVSQTVDIPDMIFYFIHRATLHNKGVSLPQLLEVFGEDHNNCLFTLMEALIGDKRLVLKDEQWWVRSEYVDPFLTVSKLKKKEIHKGSHSKLPK